MKVGIVGLPSSGKTTLFRALTRGAVKIEPFGSEKPNIGVVSVPDRRVDFLTREYHPKKVTYASIEFIDGAARISREEGRARFGSDFFADVRQVDALAHVVRGFVSGAGEPPNPIQDAQALHDELLLADLQVVENRVQRVEKQLHGVKKGQTTSSTIEMSLLESLKTALENGESLKTLQLGPEEEKAVRGYDFLTLKPMIVILNLPESEIGSPGPGALDFRKYCVDAGIQEIELCAEVEMEVSELSDEEEAEFLKSMGIEEPARNILIRECYKALGLLSFITAGDPEVRAWTLRDGSTALEAAGAIHSDLARGFIRVEVANFADIEPVGGWEPAKRQGIVQLHGKEYVMRDGDVIYIRFKV